MNQNLQSLVSLPKETPVLGKKVSVGVFLPLSVHKTDSHFHDEKKVLVTRSDHNNGEF
jgi:hypothetical protein